MKCYGEQMEKVPLFSGIGREDIDKLLTCLQAVERRYRKDEMVVRAGEPVPGMGIVLEGRIQVVREEVTGDRTILTEALPGALFAEAYGCASGGGTKLIPVSVISVAKSTVLMLNCRKITETCPSACAAHARLIENMLGVLADKNILLNRKIGHMAKRSTREKLMSYLSEQAALQGCRTFTIPFNRQELADYLCVDRSAMSATLSKLREEGVLLYRRNRFELL